MGLLKVFKKEKAPTSPLEFEISGLLAYADQAKEVMGKNPYLSKPRKKTGRLYVLAPFEGLGELIVEPGKKKEKPTIKVVVDKHQLGFVPEDRVDEVQVRLKAGQKVIITLNGGNYQEREDDEWVTYKGYIHGKVTICKGA